MPRRASQGVETVVVDNDSSDGTVAFVRERFPEVRVVEQENLGLAAGWARGLEEISPSRWVLILNADAWLAGDALERMVAVGDAHPGRRRRGAEAAQPGRVAAAVGARLPDALAARHRVPLPPQARAADGAPERLLRRGVRPRLGARGRVRDGRLHARPSRRDRRGRPAGRELLPLQRGGRLVLPLRAGGLERRSSRPRRAACTSAAPRTAGASSARTSAVTCASSSSTTAPRRPSASGRCSHRSLVLRGRIVPGRAGCDVPRRRPLARDGRRSLADRAMSSLFLLVRLAAATGLVLAPGAIAARAVGRAEHVGDARLGARDRVRRHGRRVPRPRAR